MEGNLGVRVPRRYVPLELPREDGPSLPVLPVPNDGVGAEYVEGGNDDTRIHCAAKKRAEVRFLLFCADRVSECLSVSQERREPSINDK